MDGPLAYYNENDPFAAAWLVELISAGVIANGVVDTRDIQDVRADELEGYTQCHFFAGLGGWSYALRIAGYPDDRPVWTGSCPCQPYSSAGKGAGASDPRHLWPVWFNLIRECQPATVIGEQVENAIGHGWWDAVQRDLEGEGYACGMAVLGAHSVGAPHIRQRLWFVAESVRATSERGTRSILGAQTQVGGTRIEDGCVADGFADGGEDGCSVAESNGHQRRQECAHAGGIGEGSGAQGLGERFMRGGDGKLADAQRVAAKLRWSTIESRESNGAAGAGASVESGRCGDISVGVDNATSTRRDAPLTGPESETRNKARMRGLEPGRADGCVGESGGAGSFAGYESATPARYGDSVDAANFWSSCVWLPCRDGKLRPVEKTTQPGIIALANGLSGDLGLVRLQNYPDHTDAETWIYAPLIAKGRQRVGRLRGYGNAIVPQVAAEFISAYLEMTAGNL